MSKQEIVSKHKLDGIREMVNGLTGLKISKEDLTNEVVIKSLIAQKLNQIVNQYRKRGVKLSFTQTIPDSIISSIVNSRNPIRELNKFLKNNVMKYLLSKSTLEEYKDRSMHITDILY